MDLFHQARREFSGCNAFESKRLFDCRPLQCGLYLTGRCNLDCSYCTEYDKSKPHPQLEDLNLWIRKIRELGTMRVALVGGEPLMHRTFPRLPDCVARSNALPRSCARFCNSSNVRSIGSTKSKAAASSDNCGPRAAKLSPEVGTSPWYR